jgi:crotonobetainyl-CoA:carnitine CoA-transferase CaiB-like acyl-CoA transferase
VSIAVASDGEWRSLCTAIGRPELIEDDRFSTQLLRWTNQRELDAIVGAWTGERTDYEVTTLLQEHRVAAFPVLNSEQIFAEPHLRARGALQEMDDPQFGRRTVLAPPWRLRSRPARVTSASPRLSEDNVDIMKTLLGRSEEEIADLEVRQILLAAPAPVETASATS